MKSRHFFVGLLLVVGAALISFIKNAGEDSEIETGKSFSHADSTARSIASSEDKERLIQSPRRAPSLPLDVLRKSVQDPRRQRQAMARAKELRRANRIDGRSLALNYLGQSTIQHGVLPIPGLAALPLRDAKAEGLDQEALYVTSSWAIFPGEDHPSFAPVAYNFQEDRWGVYTGMIEVEVEAGSSAEEVAAAVERSTGLPVHIKGAKEGSFFVASPQKTVQRLEELRHELSQVNGAKSARSELIYTWRKPL